MATIIPLHTFRYWLKNTYPQIYDENKTDYELLFELRYYYITLKNKLNAITQTIAQINVEKNGNFETFNTWFMNQSEADPNIEAKIQAATDNGTITTMAENIEKLDSLVFDNIY